jgi:uncharacterized membrane protein YeaQ/YmgE (transglycosylase-associated protein family)
MNLIAWPIPWLLAGAAAGWVSGRLIRAPGGVAAHLVLGAMGAWLGGWLLGPMMGAGTLHHGGFGLASLGVALLGAINLLVLVKVVQQVRGQ